MRIPRRPVNLCDLMDDIEACGYKLVFLVIDHDGKSDFYDSEDIEFVDPELYERDVKMYELKMHTKRKCGLNIILSDVPKGE